MTAAKPRSQPIGVAIVDADPAQRRVLADIVRRDARFQVTEHSSGATAREALGVLGNGIMIADLETVGGVEEISAIADGQLATIATSASASLNDAVAALRGGAVDFLPKPVGARALLKRLVETVHAPDDRLPGPAPQPKPVRGGDEHDSDFAGFIGRSPVMEATYAQIQQVASSQAPVFITGASGTGKEICAKAIHRHAGASGKGDDRPFIAINCSAIPSELMESEMFGHVRGAFTGAIAERTGAAELAHGGTLFLDEISEMGPGLQAKLLRFLQSGEIRPVGGTATRRVETRIICATNRDPAQIVASGEFRSDLYYRLHVLPIHMSPLQRRGDDIRLLAHYFLQRYADEEDKQVSGITPTTMSFLVTCAWPGNVRQLANVIRRMVVMAESETITPDLLPAEVVGSSGPDMPTPALSGVAAGVAIEPLWRQERRAIEQALAAHDGNVARAAAALEIAPSTIHRKRQTWRT